MQIMPLNEQDESLILIAASTLLLGTAAEQMMLQSVQRRKKRKCWVKEWLTCRKKFGAYHALVLEFSLNDHGEYHRFMRMDPETFQVNKNSL